MRSNRERMIDIQEAIFNIEKYSNLGKEKFFTAFVVKSQLYDLAIFGGKPLFDEKQHVGRPNLGDRTLNNN